MGAVLARDVILRRRMLYTYIHASLHTCIHTTYTTTVIYATFAYLPEERLHRSILISVQEVYSIDTYPPIIIYKYISPLWRSAGVPEVCIGACERSSRYTYPRIERGDMFNRPYIIPKY